MASEIWTSFFEKTSNPYNNHCLSLGEIRLVDLQPGAWSDEIHCKLRGELLQNKPEFEAVSYVWGSPKNTRHITLNGQKHTATINLDSALRRLRHPEYARTIWVDALCIDQSNATERTHQVGLMGEIYKAASRVVVFLGDGVDRCSRKRRATKVFPTLEPIEFTGEETDTKHVEKCIRTIRNSTEHELMRRFEKDVCDFSAAFSVIRMLAQDNHLGDLTSKLKEQLGQQAEDGMVYLFESLRRFTRGPWTPWWERIWVVQEVAFPRSVTVVYGHISAQWDMIAAAARSYLRHSSSCCSNAAPSFPRDQHLVLADFSRRVLDIDHLRSTIGGQTRDARYVHAFKSKHTYRRAGGEQIERRTLISLLRRFRARKSSDARDKIYALLSLIQYEPGQSAMIPDYTIDAVEVFKRAALESIYNTGTLSVLPTDLGPKYRNDLPSWVPDWDAPESHTHRSWIEAATLYDVCTNFPANSDTVQNIGDTLHVQGMHIGTISWIQNVMWADNHDIVSTTILHWWSLGLYWKQAKFDVPDFWKLFCADIICSTSSSAMSTEYRRSRPDDELRFILWALNAEKSPFRDTIPASAWNDLLEDYFQDARQKKKTVHGTDVLMELLSENGRAWCRFLVLQKSVRSKNAPKVWAAMLAIVPDKREREMIAIELVKKTELPASEKETWLGALSIDLASVRSRITSLDEDLEDYMGRGEEDRYLETLHGLIDLRRASEAAWAKFTWDDVLQHLESWIEHRYKCGSLKSVGHENLVVATMDRSIMSATLSRRLFATSSMIVGLAPADAKLGDKVLLIKGGRTPFLLRSVNDRQIQRLGRMPLLEPEPLTTRNVGPTSDDVYESLLLRYQTLSRSRDVEECELIGEIYAHGLMDASSLEKIPTVTPENPDQLKWKSFEIV